jgi:hypothetical protein
MYFSYKKLLVSMLVKLTPIWRAIFLTVVRVIAKLVFQKWFQVSAPRTTYTPFVFIVHFFASLFSNSSKQKDKDKICNSSDENV